MVTDRTLENVRFWGNYWLPISAENVTIKDSNVEWNAPDSILTNSRAIDSSFTKGLLSRSAIENVTFNTCSLNKTDLSHSGITDTHFTECTFLKTYFNHSIFESVVFERCTFSKTLFLGSTFTNVTLIAPTFELPSFTRGATIVGGNFENYVDELEQGTIELAPPPETPASNP